MRLTFCHSSFNDYVRSYLLSGSSIRLSRCHLSTLMMRCILCMRCRLISALSKIRITAPSRQVNDSKNKQTEQAQWPQITHVR